MSNRILPGIYVKHHLIELGVIGKSTVVEEDVSSIPHGWIFAGFMVSIKHLKNSNAACFYTPILLKLLIII